ncbi:hypothetical protein INT45_003578 [Circinella minor]|uniref:Uncharacterized protein n=1 Tax=Circinella minor TaxID=1195481 RepID=A0A8H7S1J2_9FUNG|nr:hypothetical protein INT45_003578 [Circinella minor]
MTPPSGSGTPTGSPDSDQEMDHVLHLQNQVTANQQEKSWADQVEDLTTEKQSVDMETNNNFLHLYPNLPDFLQDIYKKQETTDKKVSELTEALSNMAQIIKENATLRIELEAARAEIALLKNKQVTLDPIPYTKKALRPTIQILDNEDDGLAQSKYAPPPAQVQQQLKNNYAAVVTRGIKKQPIKKRTVPSKRAKEIAARHLTAVPESQGFQFMHVPCRHRMTIKATRQILCTLRVDNSRILDVHFPDRQVAALLIHNDYAQSLTEILEKEGIQIKKEFDPLDPSILRVQKLANLTDEERFEKVQELHHNNLLKALQFIRTPVKFAVARNFYKNSWITAEELASFLPTYKTHEDRILDAKRLLNNDTKSVTSSRPISPSMEIDDEIEASSYNTTSTSTTQNN